jgi:hypothetical protein
MFKYMIKMLQKKLKEKSTTNKISEGLIPEAILNYIG